MIDKALLLIQSELNNYLSSHDLSSSTEVTVDNIAMLETSSGDNLTGKIVISVVNVEEESTLKNQRSRLRNPPTGTIYLNPPVYLNLYVLFTSNYAGATQYIAGLQRISYVIQFLQSKNSFSSQSTIGDSSVGITNTASSDLLNLWFTLELYTLTFEQLNHLWGSLGGRQVPFVMYKLRLVAITERNIIRTTPVILEIDTDISTAL
jgi:hypothetical protein